MRPYETVDVEDSSVVHASVAVVKVVEDVTEEITGAAASKTVTEAETEEEIFPAASFVHAYNVLDPTVAKT